MNAQELRIGNYVINMDDLCKVTALSDQGDVYFNIPYDDPNKDNFSFIQHIIPIELTPEVLEACGFEFDERNIKWKINKNSSFEFSFDESGLHINYSVCRKNVEHVKQLHQLQNLYYAITGKELNIDIDKLKNAVK